MIINADTRSMHASIDGDTDIPVALLAKLDNSLIFIISSSCPLLEQCRIE